MTSHLNLIGSILIGGLLLLMINRYHSSLDQNVKENVMDSITKQNSTSISNLIEFDLNRMGLGVSMTTNVLIQADSNRITFLSDIDQNGAVDTVRYFLSDTTVAYSTANPRDVVLYRLINTQAPEDAAMGVTRFHIRYLDAIGNETANLSQIRTFEVTLNVESTAAYNDHYATFFWQTRVTPPNLIRF